MKSFKISKMDCLALLLIMVSSVVFNDDANAKEFSSGLVYVNNVP